MNACAQCGHTAEQHLPEDKGRGECCAYVNGTKRDCPCVRFRPNVLNRPNVPKKER